MEQLKSLLENSTADPTTLVLACTTGGLASAVVLNAYLEWRRRDLLSKSTDVNTYNSMFFDDGLHAGRRSSITKSSSSSSSSPPARYKADMTLLREAASPGRSLTEATTVRTPNGRQALFSPSKKQKNRGENSRARRQLDLDSDLDVPEKFDELLQQETRTAVFAEWERHSPVEAQLELCKLHAERIEVLERLHAQAEATLLAQTYELEQHRRRNAELIREADQLRQENERLNNDNEQLCLQLQLANDALASATTTTPRDASPDHLTSSSSGNLSLSSSSPRTAARHLSPPPEHIHVHAFGQVTETTGSAAFLHLSLPPHLPPTTGHHAHIHSASVPSGPGYFGSTPSFASPITQQFPSLSDLEFQPHSAQNHRSRSLDSVRAGEFAPDSYTLPLLASTP